MLLQTVGQVVTKVYESRSSLWNNFLRKSACLFKVVNSAGFTVMILANDHVDGCKLLPAACI